LALSRNRPPRRVGDESKDSRDGISGDRAFQLRDEGGKILGLSHIDVDDRAKHTGTRPPSTSRGRSRVENRIPDEVASSNCQISHRSSATPSGPVRLEESSVLATRVKRGRAVT